MKQDCVADDGARRRNSKFLLSNLSSEMNAIIKKFSLARATCVHSTVNLFDNNMSCQQYFTYQQLWIVSSTATNFFEQIRAAKNFAGQFTSK